MGRPDVVPHLVTVVGLSFPSGHSMAVVVIYLTLGALLARFAARRRIRVYVIAISLSLTFRISITRVCLGVHYPTDVLAGWAARGAAMDRSRRHVQRPDRHADRAMSAGPPVLGAGLIVVDHGKRAEGRDTECTE